MALYADVSYDSRVQREAATLVADGHEVTIVCLSGSAPVDAPFRVVAGLPPRGGVLPDGGSPFLLVEGASAPRRLAARGRWLAGYARAIRSWGRWAVETAGAVDAWHAHDLTGLAAVGPLVLSPTRLVYDSHEIFLETGTAARLPGVGRRLLRRLERWLVGRADALVTVNEAYARVLERRTRPRRVVVVRNCPPRQEEVADRDISPLRRAVGIPVETPLLLYHGALAPHRGIEATALALLEPGLESAHAAILGFGSLRTDLEAMATDPRFEGRLHLLDAVPPDELLGWVAGADVDVIALERSTLNHWFCTPNKLWESIAVGVPVVVSDFPVMSEIVCDDPMGPLGATCDPTDVRSVAAAVRSVVDLLPDERWVMRARCAAAARERWNWETESARLVALYRDLATG